MSASVYQFGDFRLDCGRYELLREGRSLRLERKPMELLILLVSREGQLVTRSEIAERLWSSEVFVDTEHGINTAIRKIRNILHDDPENPQFVQTIQGMGYRLVAPVVTELAPAALAAPGKAEERSPEIAAPGRAQPAPQRARWRTTIWTSVSAAVLLASLILAVMAGPHRLAARLLHRDAPPTITSLAVLPLNNLSGDPSQDSFADSMTDELITMLTKDSTLKVTSRTSMMQYKGAHKSVPEIARELGVDGILEGSVSHTADRVHMTVQLIYTPTDTHLWAESYDRSLNDASAVPDEAAHSIAMRVHQALPAMPVARYVNPAAHDAYLRGRYLWENFHYDEAGKNFLYATQLQPDYAAAWAGVSAYYGGNAVDGYMDPRDAMPKAESAAIKAIQLDPSSADGHGALGAIFFFYHWDWARARQEVRRAIELDPRLGDAYQLEAKLFAALNQKEEAVEVQKKAMEFNPFVRPWGLVMTYDATRQYDAAIEDARFRLQTYPHNPSLLYNLSDVYRCKKMYKEAAEYLARGLEADGYAKASAEVKAAFARGGYPAVVRWQIDANQQQGKSGYASPLDQAQLYAILGDREKTLDLLEEGLAQRSPELVFIETDPAYDFLHSDPRFRSVVQRVGLPPIQ